MAHFVKHRLAGHIQDAADNYSSRLAASVRIYRLNDSRQTHNNSLRQTTIDRLFDFHVSPSFFRLRNMCSLLPQAGQVRLGLAC
jgi:hypothetical protein